MRCVFIAILLGFLSTTFANLPAVENAVHWNGIEANDLTLSEVSGEYEIVTRGDDPYLVFDLPAVESVEGEWILSMETFCPNGIPGMQFFAGLPFRSQTLVSIPSIEASEGWVSYNLELSKLRQRPETASSLTAANLSTSRATRVRIDFGRRGGRRLKVRKIVLRRPTPDEIQRKADRAQSRLRKETLARRIYEYETNAWPAEIISATHDGNSFNVSGRVDLGASASDKKLAIVPRFAHETSAQIASPESIDSQVAIKLDQEGGFTVSMDASLDPIGLRFQVVDLTNPDTPEALSACRYPEVVATADANELARTKKLQFAKGLTCMGEFGQGDAWRKLGLEHASINILLNHLVTSTPREGYRSIEVAGKRMHYHVDMIAAIDSRMRRLRSTNIVVAGILLISNRPSQTGSLVHPEADPDGTYAMPNLVAPEASAHYADTIRFLADRYSGVHDDQLRIDHWIVHNEVDAAWHWTNMGEQPMAVYLDHYFRSLRIVDTATRRHNPHARAFISLTHYWSKSHGLPWRTYPPKSILDALAHHGSVEGDFPWAVAYHPYPQSLWKSDTWNDPGVNDRFDTPYITIKNLPVLQRYLDQPEMQTADGESRDMILSEQGFHASEDDPESLERQSAALLYAFEQIRKCPSVLAFDYHRPIDHPNEGGLRLGLRGMRTKRSPNGAAKPAWMVYQAIGTKNEEKLRKKHEAMWLENR